MTKKIFRSICMAAMIVFLISLALIMGALYGYFSNIQMRQLHIQADMAARGESGIWRNWTRETAASPGLIRTGESFSITGRAAWKWKTIWKEKKLRMP